MGQKTAARAVKKTPNFRASLAANQQQRSSCRARLDGFVCHVARCIATRGLDAKGGSSESRPPASSPYCGRSCYWAALSCCCCGAAPCRAPARAACGLSLLLTSEVAATDLPRTGFNSKATWVRDSIKPVSKLCVQSSVLTLRAPDPPGGGKVSPLLLNSGLPASMSSPSPRRDDGRGACAARPLTS